MVKKHFAFLILVIVCISFVSAIDTNVNIKTLPGHEVQVSASKVGTVSFELLNSSKGTSDEYGDASFVLSFNEAKYNLFIYVKKEGKTILPPNESPYKSYDLISGKDVSIKLIPEWAEFIETPKANNTNVSLENKTIGNETVLIKENETEKSGFSGGVISEKIKGIFTNKIFYYAIGIVVLGIFVLVLRGRKSKGAREIKVRKLSEMNSERDEHEKKSAEVAAAERKMKEAQQELNRLKNADKIEEMENKLKKQQEELERLKKGGD